jgi:dTDP-4-amino-4,6-dideoxygalactose transaminase
MTEKVPMLDLRGQTDALWPEIEARVREVLRSGRFILGPNVESFEKECADYLGVRHAVGVNSGTDALLIGLRAMDIGPGDEVITSSFTFFATAEAIGHVGAVPIFVDILPETFGIDTDALRSAIGPQPRAILPVHLFGQAVDMDPLLAIAEEHDLAVLEDAAQAFGGSYKGQRLGSLGTAGAFSFFPSKNLGAYGDGGLLATNNTEIAKQARALREHGSTKRYRHETLGYNSRLDELQASILRVKLPHVDRWNEARRRLAKEYNQRLSTCPGVQTPVEERFATHVYSQYTIRIPEDRREDAMRALESKGFSSAIHYPTPLHTLPLYADRFMRLPHAELACKEVLSLPIWPELDSETLSQIADTLVTVF